MLQLILMVVIVCFFIVHPIIGLVATVLYIPLAFKFEDWVVKKDRERIERQNEKDEEI